MIQFVQSLIFLCLGSLCSKPTSSNAIGFLKKKKISKSTALETRWEYKIYLFYQTFYFTQSFMYPQLN